MMKWQCEKIIEDLKILVGDTANVTIGEIGPGGDYDTTPIYIEPLVKLNPYDAVCISGMSTITMSADSENPIHDIPYVEIKNVKSDSSGGLSRRATPQIRDLYSIACGYFNELDVEVIRHYHEIF